MGPKSKRSKNGAQNRSRAPAEFKAGQRVLNGGKIAHITDVVYDNGTKAHVYTIRVENDVVQSLLAICNESQAHLNGSRWVSR